MWNLPGIPGIGIPSAFVANCANIDGSMLRGTDGFGVTAGTAVLSSAVKGTTGAGGGTGFGTDGATIGDGIVEGGVAAYSLSCFANMLLAGSGTEVESGE
jgi:hypothetical protein